MRFPALRLLLAIQVVRHTVVLANTKATTTFLARAGAEGATSETHVPAVAVILPLLREEAVIADAVAHFRELLRDADMLVLVTSAREGTGSDSRTDTPVLAARLADGAQVRHVHLSDPHGRKGDQINFAARSVASWLPLDEHRNWLTVVYDADSRPPRGSLLAFADAAARHHGVDVFHQSARFEVRSRGLSVWESALAQAGALRANRFVLAYEMPRLRSRAPGAGPLRRRMAAVTYGHVSGHGLGLRLSFLLARPMPARTAMEDMHYSYGLAADRVAVVPLATLDSSEVPTPWRTQFRQAERWFAGPGRGLSYAHERRSAGNRPAAAVMTSALLISLEWLSCAAALPLLLGMLGRPGANRRLAVTFLVLYGLELLVVDRQTGRRPRRARVAGWLAFPLVNTGFGIAGWSALFRPLTGRQLTDKTER